MNARAVFSQAFLTGIRQWRIAAIVYVIQFCLALTLGMEVHNVLEASIGHSLEINKLIAHYDHTVMSDFLKVHGASITPLIGQLRWLLLVWLFFSVFIDAGMLFTARQTGSIAGRMFWEGGARYFFPFLKIVLLLLVPVLVWTLVILIPIGMYLQPALEHFSSEAGVVWMVIALLLLYLIGLVKFYIWSVLSRLYRLQHNISPIHALRMGLRIFWKNKWLLLSFVFGFVGLQVLLFMLYWWLESVSGMTTPVLILVFFLVQQAFVFFRVQIRQMMYAGIALIQVHDSP
jgi:hypothetical protein